MAKPTKKRDRVYLQLAELRAEEAALIAEVEAIPEVQRLKVLKAAIAALQDYAVASGQRTGAIKISRPGDGPFARMSLPDAAMKQLEIAGPQTTEQIWGALSAGGITLTAEKPINAVHWALSRRRKKGAPLHLENKVWSLVATTKKGGMANRDRGTHIQKTKDGIAHFKARTGASWGRRRTVTAEQIEIFREAYDNGVPAVQAAKRAGFSNAYFHSNREDMLAWKPGLPWPLPRGVTGDELRAMGIIPMHARVIGEK
jgi:hypothetical protein